MNSLLGFIPENKVYNQAASFAQREGIGFLWGKFDPFTREFVEHSSEYVWMVSMNRVLNASLISREHEVMVAKCGNCKSETEEFRHPVALLDHLQRCLDYQPAMVFRFLTDLLLIHCQFLVCSEALLCWFRCCIGTVKILSSTETVC